MNHAEAWPLIELLADGELDAVTAAAVEEHACGCPDCARRLETLIANRAVLRRALDPGPAPSALTDRIARLAEPAPPRRVFLPQWALQAAAVAGVAILSSSLTFGVMRQGEAHRAADAEAGALIDAHVRALEPGRMIEVVSSDKHTVKPWLDARLDFAPPVTAFDAQGFPLIGGRLDYVEGRRAAVLVYGRRKHVIDVFVSPSTGPAPNTEGGRNGFHALAWRSGGFDWRAVSDVGTDELGQLRRLIETASA